MTNLFRPAFGHYLVFVDESGDHSLTSIDSQYSVFVLAFAIIKKTDYIQRVCPDLQSFKLRYWGHDETVLHEHEIRKPRDGFSFLQQKPVRERFLSELTGLMEALPATIVAVVIDKPAFVLRYAKSDLGGVYDHAMETGLNAVFQFLSGNGQSELLTSVVVERRGRKEDNELELSFRRFCDTSNAHSRALPFDLVMVPKTANSAGLQIADLIARPVGLHALRPQQKNRAFEIIQTKLHRGDAGQVEGVGLLRVP
jgi:Protein of unknown function (DUF3800)